MLNDILKYFAAGWDIIQDITKASKDGVITKEEVLEIVDRAITDFGIKIDIPVPGNLTDDPLQLTKVERASVDSNKAQYKSSYSTELSDQTVVSILKPGWDKNENGTQLWNRMLSYWNLQQSK